ncbi:MAG TPA: hypothetical protein VFB54_00300 [Burkholderiales bacterium]|nr:hypothetical protein [Burkholderiales bacterium]
MARLLIVIAVILVPGLAFAQAAPRAQAEAFLNTVQHGQVGPAYGKLFEGSNISNDQALGIRRSTETTLSPLGKVIGYELVREENFGSSLTRLVYLLKSERHLTVWEFYFYRPANRWFVAEVNLSQKFDALAPKK